MKEGSLLHNQFLLMKSKGPPGFCSWLIQIRYEITKQQKPVFVQNVEPSQGPNWPKKNASRKVANLYKNQTGEERQKKFDEHMMFVIVFFIVRSQIAWKCHNK